MKSQIWRARRACCPVFGPVFGPSRRTLLRRRAETLPHKNFLEILGEFFSPGAVPSDRSHSCWARARGASFLLVLILLAALSVPTSSRRSRMVGTAHYAEEFKRPQVFCLSTESKCLLGAFPLEVMGLSQRYLAHKTPPCYRRRAPFPSSFFFVSILSDACSAQVARVLCFPAGGRERRGGWEAGRGGAAACRCLQGPPAPSQGPFFLRPSSTASHIPTALRVKLVYEK